MAPAPASRQRVAAAPQRALVTGKSPKGVRHATSKGALSRMSAEPPGTTDLRDTVRRQRSRREAGGLETAPDSRSNSARMRTVPRGSEAVTCTAVTTLRWMAVVTQEAMPPMLPGRGNGGGSDSECVEKGTLAIEAAAPMTMRMENLRPARTRGRRKKASMKARGTAGRTTGHLHRRRAEALPEAPLDIMDPIRLMLNIDLIWDDIGMSFHGRLEAAMFIINPYTVKTMADTELEGQLQSTHADTASNTGWALSGLLGMTMIALVIPV